jgi:hypothetical protein
MKSKEITPELMKKCNDFTDQLADFMNQFTGDKDFSCMQAMGLGDFIRNYIRINGIASYNEYTKEVIRNYLIENGKEV